MLLIKNTSSFEVNAHKHVSKTGVWKSLFWKKITCQIMTVITDTLKPTTVWLLVLSFSRGCSGLILGCERKVSGWVFFEKGWKQTVSFPSAVYWFSFYHVSMDLCAELYLKCSLIQISGAHQVWIRNDRLSGEKGRKQIVQYSWK